MAQQIIVTIQGVDKVGIVARIAKVLAEHQVNIEDIKQTLMQGHFVMFMLCDIDGSEFSFGEIKEALVGTGKELGMEVWVQRKEIVDNMHII